MSEDLRQRFENLVEVINRATDNFNAGKAINLGDLERQVSKLCSDVLKAGTATAQDFKPYIADMIAKLDDLAQQITEFQKQAKAKKR